MEGDDDSFEPVGRKEMHEQRKEWKELVFNPRAAPHAGQIEVYLKYLFESTTESQRALKTLRESTGKFRVGCVRSDEVKATVGNLISSDLLNHKKQAALKDLRNNELVLAEIADVLNMQIDSLASWSWGTEAVPLELRRALNGKYRVFMDEDLLTAILLEYIGAKWAVFLKSRLTTFMASAWKKPAKSVAPWSGVNLVKRNRKSRFSSSHRSVEAKRWEFYRNEYFMQQLQDSFAAGSVGYGDDDASASGSYKRSFASKKQDLFHLIATESLVTSRLNGSWTILQSDFRWFGPSLPHVTIVTILRFLGVKQEWLDFFQKFLTSPLRFVHDGRNANMLTRKSGVPISHTLSDVMGEAVLFCLDFAVNQQIKSNLYRVHDDIWLWGSNENALAAWSTLMYFTEVMGMQLNSDKTGSATITRDSIPNPETTNSSPTSLPQAPVKWGFLILDSNGHWRMNSEKVQEHISELKLQLSATPSIFAWIQAWNTYVARFLSANFGEAANCLGKAHVDMVIQTFKHIQEALFASYSTTHRGNSENARNVTMYLKQELRSRFNIPSTTTIPDGILYFPLELGGLGLLSPLIPLMLVRNAAPDDPADLIATALQADEIKYNGLIRAYEAGADTTEIRALLDEYDEFISLEEFLSHAASTSESLGDAYAELMERPEELVVGLGSEVEVALGEVDSGKWREEGYWRWVFQLYGGEVIKEFGGLGMGERKLLPIGLVRMMREQRVRWRG